jgi:serine/threonine protein kinase
MLCCLNPDCDRPVNPEGNQFCQHCGAQLTPLLLNRFKILKPIGRGGFGKTYLSEDTQNLNDRCVVKQLIYQAQGTLANNKIVELFRRNRPRVRER